MRTNKKWSVLFNREQQGNVSAALAQALGLLEPTAILLYNRGFTTPESAEKFLRRDEIKFHDPFLLDGMEQACRRIERALASGERIVIYGDYDVDGVTSVSMLLLYLRSRGADAGYYIPNRSGEGYGINYAALVQLAGEGCRLLITVDTGITAVSEIEEARALGMDVIVTDHHECPAQLPDAVAVLNPKRSGSRYPFPELAGVGVVFKLISALEYRRHQSAGDSACGVSRAGSAFTQAADSVIRTGGTYAQAADSVVNAGGASAQAANAAADAGCARLNGESANNMGCDARSDGESTNNAGGDVRSGRESVNEAGAVANAGDTFAQAADRVINTDGTYTQAADNVVRESGNASGAANAGGESIPDMEPAQNAGDDWLRALCENYIDLAALGTVADVMPLVDENRLIVTLGLRFIEKTRRPGLAALLELAGVTPQPGTRGTSKRKRITSSLVGYVIAPRINAAGRISCASKAVELFLTESPGEAKKIAAELCDTNRERQNEENSIIEQTYRKIEKEHDFDRDRVIVLAENDWHHGVIGIVSSRITEHYNLPSILISFDGSDSEGDPGADIGKGSGRSIKGLNLVEALNYCSDLLVKFGGHELAAGLSIERAKLPEFRRRINEYARAHLTEGDLATTIDVDCELRPNEITLRQANELYLLEPFGIANPVPVFALRNARIADVSSIGSGKHTKLTLDNAHGADPLTAICFGVPPALFDFYTGDICDLIFNLGINEFMGTQTAQLIVRDIDGSAGYKEDRERERALYEEIKDGSAVVTGLDFVPTRDDFASVYLYIKHEIRQGSDILSLHKICRHFEGVRPINPVKLRFIIDILRETNILGVERVGTDNPHSGAHAVKMVASRCVELYRFKIHSFANKVNLEKSTIYRRLRSRQSK